MNKYSFYMIKLASPTQIRIITFIIFLQKTGTASAVPALLINLNRIIFYRRRFLLIILDVYRFQQSNHFLKQQFYQRS